MRQWLSSLPDVLLGFITRFVSQAVYCYFLLVQFTPHTMKCSLITPKECGRVLLSSGFEFQLFCIVRTKVLSHMRHTVQQSSVLSYTSCS